jgi:hypothetical protein
MWTRCHEATRRRVPKQQLLVPKQQPVVPRQPLLVPKQRLLVPKQRLLREEIHRIHHTPDRQ